MNSLLHSSSRDDLQQALRILKDYRNAYKQIGQHASVRDPRVAKEKTIRVQLAVSPENKDTLMPFVEKAIAEYFPEAGDAPRVFEQKKSLVGGMRIFYGDDMIDVSFEKYAHTVTHSL